MVRASTPQHRAALIASLCQNLITRGLFATSQPVTRLGSLLSELALLSLLSMHGFASASEGQRPAPKGEPYQKLAKLPTGYAGLKLAMTAKEYARVTGIDASLPSEGMEAIKPHHLSCLNGHFREADLRGHDCSNLVVDFNRNHRISRIAYCMRGNYKTVLNEYVGKYGSPRIQSGSPESSTAGEVIHFWCRQDGTALQLFAEHKYPMELTVVLADFSLSADRKVMRSGKNPCLGK